MNNLGIRTGVVKPLPITYDDDSTNEPTCACRQGILAPQEVIRLAKLGGEGSLDGTSSQKGHTASRHGWQTMSNAEPIFRARNIFHCHSVACVADARGKNEDLTSKPLLMQKEVGELLQPVMKLLSGTHCDNMLGMPTNTKSVHFDELRNETRYFLEVDNTMTVERSMRRRYESCLSARPLCDASYYPRPSPTSSPVHCLSGSSGNKMRFGVDLISFLLVFAITLSASYLVFGGPKIYP
jgi:hypothetical protein